MAVMPLPDNTRIEITIQPWAIKGTDTTRLDKSLLGLWFTNLNPLYANSKSLEIQAGAMLAAIPTSLLKLALFDASRWVDAIANPTCSNPDLVFFNQIRYRYVILRALASIISEQQGVFPVRKKMLGDFLIEFNTSDGDSNMLSRLLDEMAKLEPVITSGGCLGLGTGHGGVVTVKGANDPYRPVVSRGWYEPDRGDSGIPNEIVSPGWNRSKELLPERYRRNHNRSIRGRDR